MNEVQRNYILATQRESLKQKHGLDEILDVCEIEESNPCMITSHPFSTYTSNRVYGTKDDKLMRVRGIGNWYVVEEMRMHPYLEVGLGIGAGALTATVALYGIPYAVSEIMIYFPDPTQQYGTIESQARAMKELGALTASLTFVLVALKEFPSAIKAACYEKKIWKKFKNQKD